MHNRAELKGWYHATHWGRVCHGFFLVFGTRCSCVGTLSRKTRQCTWEGGRVASVTCALHLGQGLISEITFPVAISSDRRQVVQSLPCGLDGSAWVHLKGVCDEKDHVLEAPRRSLYRFVANVVSCVHKMRILVQILTIAPQPAHFVPKGSTCITPPMGLVWPELIAPLPHVLKPTPQG